MNYVTIDTKHVTVDDFHATIDRKYVTIGAIYASYIDATINRNNVITNIVTMDDIYLRCDRNYDNRQYLCNGIGMAMDSNDAIT